MTTTILDLGDGSVYAGAAWSPDGKVIALNRKDVNATRPYLCGQLTLLDASTLAVVKQLPLSAITSPEKMLWSPDGQFLLALCNEYRFYALHVPTMKIVFHDTQASNISRAYIHLSWTPDSKFFTYLKKDRYDTGVVGVHGEDAATLATTIPGFLPKLENVWMSNNRLLQVFPRFDAACLTFDNEDKSGTQGDGWWYSRLNLPPDGNVITNANSVSPDGRYVSIAEKDKLSVSFVLAVTDKWTHNFEPAPADATVGWRTSWGWCDMNHTIHMIFLRIIQHSRGTTIHAHLFHMFTEKPLLATIDLTDKFSQVENIAWSPDNRYIIVSGCKKGDADWRHGHIRYDLYDYLPAHDRKRCHKPL